MNSGIAQQWRRTPRPPHGLYVGTVIQFKDSTHLTNTRYMAFYRLGNAALKLLHSCRLGAHARTFLVTRLFPFVSNRLSARTGLHLHLQPEWRFLPLLTPA
jgi:hypothetical protein